MRPLDALLLEVAAAIRIRATRETIDVAVRNIATIPFATADDHGAGKAEAARGLRHLVVALARFNNADARAALAGAIEIAAKAIKAEPDAPRVRPAPAPRRHTQLVAAKTDERPPFYLRD